MPHLARNQISRTDLRKILDALKKPRDPNAKAIKFRNIPSVHDRAKALGAEIRPVTPPEPKHTLTVIGWMGTKRAYLDVTEEEAIRRYCETEGTDPEMLKSDGLKAETFPFVDEFCVYDAWMSR